MRILLFSIIFFGINFGLFSQNSNSTQYTAASESDPAAKLILDDLRDKYEAFESMEASFTISIEIPEEDKIIQKGKVAQKGDSYRLDMQDRSIITDGTTLWYYLPDNNEVQINDAEDLMEDQDFLSPESVLKMYESGDFIYVLADEYVRGGKIVQQIEFKPIDREADYHKIRLMVDKKARTILSVKAFSKDGSRYTFSIEQLMPNKKFAAAHFRFEPSKYPDLHVEDLRL